MKILVYGLNFSPELVGVGKYTGELAHYLAGAGHDVHVITAPPYYPQWKIAPPFKSWWYSYTRQEAVAVYRCPLYVPAAPGKLTRLIHLASFALSSLPLVLGQVARRPDVVIVIEPTFFAVPAALLCAKLCGAKSVLHIQDYEIDAMIKFGIAESGWLSRLALKLEGCLMRAFDRVSSISRSMLDIARSRGVAAEKLVKFPNWVDTARLSPVAEDPEYRRQLGVPADARVVLHAGNIGKKQGLELLLDAAEHFHDRRDVVFLIVGQGAEKKTLQAMARTRGLGNVIFTGLQPMERLPQLFAMAQVHVVLQKEGADGVVFPSRLTGLLSVGGNILVSTREGNELYELARQLPGIFRCIEPGNPDDLIAALEDLLVGKARRYNRVARRYAEEFLSSEVVLSDFERTLQDLIARG